MQRSDQHAFEFLTLSTAAVIVYHQVTGQPLKPMAVGDANAILEAVAGALAEVAPIYVLDAGAGTFKTLDAAELQSGVFERGATLFRTSQSDYYRLAVRRGDMRAAIELFRQAGRRF